MKNNYVSKKMDSPVGRIRLVVSDKGLTAILWENDNPRRVPLENVVEDENHPLLLKTEQQLNEYFAGKRQSFSLDLDFNGTDFQKKVWQALLTIPFGETRSYERSPARSEIRRQSAPSGQPMAKTRSRLLLPVTG